MLSTDIKILNVECDIHSFDYRSPMKFGGRVVTSVDLFNVRCEVETIGGKRGIGVGSMTMGNAWSWPSQNVSSDKTLKVIEDIGQRFASEALTSGLQGHPLRICHELSKQLESIAQRTATDHGITEAVPRLAQLLAGSPIEAAIFDAHGKALETSCYSLLGREYIREDLSSFLNDDFKGLHLDRFVTQQPRQNLPLYHLVGALDPLSEGDIETPLGDGVPETLADWIEADGLTHLKIKLAGDDLDWDVARVVAISTIASKSSRGEQNPWQFSLDFNERCENEQYVIDMISGVREREPIAIDRIQYVEQPTHRDLARFPDNTMHEVTKLLPVVIDESLIDLESLQLSRALGYSGVALKACKGHSEALLMGAAAQHYGLFLCVQDLTCVGASFLHSASLASHIPNVAAIEGNGRQYCPKGNDNWNTKFPGMFDIHDGTVDTGLLTGPALGISPLGFDRSIPIRSVSCAGTETRLAVASTKHAV